MKAPVVIAAFASVVQAQTNYCGTTWVDAVSLCINPCPTGAPTECALGETCFANTLCVVVPVATPSPIAAYTVYTPLQQQQQDVIVDNEGENWDGGLSNDGMTNVATFSTEEEEGGVSGTTTNMCGSGSRGNGLCPISTDCCSQYGYCGTDPEHCATPLPPVEAAAEAAATTGIVEQTGGTCGGGNVGNGLCPISTDCCSEYGFCGTSIEHCTASTTATATATTTTQQQDTTGLAIVYPSQVSTSIPASTIGQIVYPSPVATPTMQQPQLGASTIPVSSQSTFIATSPPAISTIAEVETPQFNSNGILIPVVPTSQQAITSPQVYGTCGNGNTGNGICVLNSDCCSVTGFCGTTLEHCTNKAGPSMPGQPLYDTTVNTLGDGTTTTSMTNGDAAAGGGGGVTNAVVGTDPTYVPVNMDRDPTIGTTSAGVLEELLQHETTATTTTSNLGGIAITSSPHGTDKRIIGYYAGWQWYDRDKLANPDTMDFTKVQRVNYAFFQPDALGNIYGTDRWGDPQLLFGPYVPFMEGGAFTGVKRCSYDGPAEVNCAYHERERGLIHLAHSQGAEVYPSIGGWTLSQHFPALSADPVARDNFAKKCIDILAYHNFDGIDIDWEYPGFVDHSGTPADTENFTKLLTAIRAGLEAHTRETGKVYGLTAALPCNPDNIKNIQVDKLIHVLSEWNLMTYDFFGAWDEKTGTNAPLYHQGFGNEAFNVDACVENYVALGVPRAKINIGLPFYGRSYKFASELNQVHGGSDTANWGEDDGTPQYFNIHKKLQYMTQVRDNKSKTQYAYISHKGQKQQQPQQSQPQQQQQQSQSQQQDLTSWGLLPGSRRLDMTETTTSSLALEGGVSGDIIGNTLPEGLVSFDDERAICDKVHYVQEKELGGFIIWELSGDILDTRTDSVDLLLEENSKQTLLTPLLDVTNMKLANPEFQCCTLHSHEECEKERLELEQESGSQQWEVDGFDYATWQGTPGGSIEKNDGRRVCTSSIMTLLWSTLACTVVAIALNR